MTLIEPLQAPTQVTDVAVKLAALRSLFTEHSLDAYLIPSADEHLNEYLPEVKQRRRWASGFTGSSGDFLVGQTQAWVFVDSRYYEQAGLEVDTDLIQVSKVGLDDHKTLEEVVEALGREAAKAGKPFRLGYDSFTLSVSQFHDFHKNVEPWGVVLVPIAVNLVDQVRSQKPGQMKFCSLTPIRRCLHCRMNKPGKDRPKANPHPRKDRKGKRPDFTDHQTGSNCVAV